MSLDAALLEKLADWRPAGRQLLEVSDPASGWVVAVTADANDLVGSKLWELQLRRTPAAALDVAGLRAWGEAAAARVTGLLEPLRLIEADAPRAVALLRSETPSQRGGDRFYYEVLLHAAGTAEARRYESPGEGEPRRRQVAFSLTHEALAQFVADLTAAAA
jgi:hypothetical protein